MCYAIAEGSDRPKNPGGAQRSVLWQNGAARSSSTSQVSVFRDPTDAGDGQAVDQHGNPLQALHQVPARGTWGEVTDFEGADAVAEDSDDVGAGNSLAELAEALWPSTRSWGQSS